MQLFLSGPKQLAQDILQVTHRFVVTTSPFDVEVDVDKYSVGKQTDTHCVLFADRNLLFEHESQPVGPCVLHI